MPSSSSSEALLLCQVALELEEIKCTGGEHSFPPACRRLLNSLPGNDRCADCGSGNSSGSSSSCGNNPPAPPDWASVTFGCLLCLECSGRHRSYGVQTSFVRSVDLDAWTHAQVLAVLEGGNAQLEHFWSRHGLGQTSPKVNCRYHTKAGHFYKTHLRQHVRFVAQQVGLYGGREANRRRLYTTSTNKNAKPPPAPAPPNTKQKIRQDQPHQQQQKRPAVDLSSSEPSTTPTQPPKSCQTGIASTNMTTTLRSLSPSSRKAIAIQ